MERLTGADLSSVRLHVDSAPADLGARAFAQGESIHIAPRHYDPGSSEGRALIGHELSHVVQQREGLSSSGIQLDNDEKASPEAKKKGSEVAPKQPELERKADEQGRKVAELELKQPELEKKADAQDKKAPESEPKKGLEKKADAQDKKAAPDGDAAVPIDQLAPTLAARVLKVMRFDKGLDKDVVAGMTLAMGAHHGKAFLDPLLADPLGMRMVDEAISDPSAGLPNPSIIMRIGEKIPVGSGWRPVSALWTLVGGLTSLVLALPSYALDRLVGWAGDGSAFVKQALTSYYGVEIQDDWTLTALRHIWHTFKRVPRSQVKQSIGIIKRSDSVMALDSSFSAKTIKMARLPQNLTMGGAEQLTRTVGMKFLMKNSVYSQRMRNQNAFDMTLLHELGHGVDDKLGIMTKMGERPDFGGWRVYKGRDELIDGLLVAYYEQRLEADATFTQARGAKVNASAELDRLENMNAETYAAELVVPPTTAQGKKDALLKARADAVKQRNEQRDAAEAQKEKVIDTAVGRESGNTLTAAKYNAILKLVYSGVTLEGAISVNVDAPARKAAKRIIENHPAYKMLLFGKGSNGWERTRSELTDAARAYNGRVFYQAYPAKGDGVDPGTWVSYLAASKGQAVSHYQFRSPGEWFAELYAHYYMNTLKGEGGNHPLFDWIRREIDRQIMPDQKTRKLRTPEEIEADDRRQAQQGQQQGQGQQGQPLLLGQGQQQAQGQQHAQGQGQQGQPLLLGQGQQQAQAQQHAQGQEQAQGQQHAQAQQQAQGQQQVQAQQQALGQQQAQDQQPVPKDVTQLILQQALAHASLV